MNKNKISSVKEITPINGSRQLEWEVGSYLSSCLN